MFLCNALYAQKKMYNLQNTIKGKDSFTYFDSNSSFESYKQHLYKFDTCYN